MNSDESFLKKMETELGTGQAGNDQVRGILHREKMKPVNDDWITPNPEVFHDDTVTTKRATQKNFFKKLFIVSIIFAFISGGVFAFSLFTGRARLTGEHVKLAVTAKTFADSGEELTVRVSITNENALPMEFSKLVFNYPLGTTRDPGALKEVSRDLGTIGAGETREESYSIQLFGEQGTEKALTATVEYRLQGSNAIFEKTNLAKLNLRSSLATLTVDAPTNLLPGQQLPIKLSISGNTTNTVKNGLVVADYPDGCLFVSSDPAPSLDKNLWYLGDLPPGSQKQISLVVSCNGITNAEKNLVFTLGNQDATNERIVSSVYTSASHIVKLDSPFLATTILVGGKEFDGTVAIRQNNEANIDINWKSLVDTPINNTSIKVAISGAAFDPTKLRLSGGFFNSADNTITWDTTGSQELKNIQPGEKNSVGFSLTPKAGLTTSATIDLAVSVGGVLFGGKQENLVNATTANIPVITDLQLIPKTLYHSGLIQNSGPMPMQPGKETTFSIVWQIANTTNSVSGVVVKTTLPTNISWKNVVAPISDAGAITYNTVTREITWNAGTVGVGQNAKNIAFQVGITPSNNQVGAVPNLTSGVTLMGTDTITNTKINQTKRSMNTQLTGDTSTVGDNGKVVKAQ